MGLHPSQIIIGYEEASKKALSLLNEESLIAKTITDPHNAAEVA